MKRFKTNPFKLSKIQNKAKSSLKKNKGGIQKVFLELKNEAHMDSKKRAGKGETVPPGHSPQFEAIKFLKVFLGLIIRFR